VFAERYRLQFARSCQEGREDGSSVADTDSEEESDEYENALEEVEIDQSSELYKTIVAAIIEDDQGLENEMLDDDELDQDIDPPPAVKTEKINKDIEDVGEESTIVQSESNVKGGLTNDTVESALDDADNVHVLLEEAAGDDIKR
jgi:hypothetical protein